MEPGNPEYQPTPNCDNPKAPGWLPPNLFAFTDRLKSASLAASTFFNTQPMLSTVVMPLCTRFQMAIAALVRSPTASVMALPAWAAVLAASYTLVSVTAVCGVLLT